MKELAPFKVGDLVQRKNGRTITGTVINMWYRQRMYGFREGWMVKVRWEKATRRLSGSTHMTTTLQADALELAEDFNVTVAETALTTLAREAQEAGDYFG